MEQQCVRASFERWVWEGALAAWKWNNFYVKLKSYTLHRDIGKFLSDEYKWALHCKAKQTQMENGLVNVNKGSNASFRK